jgi:hypothetical protein
MAAARARFNERNVVGVKFKAGSGEYTIQQHKDYSTKVDLIPTNGSSPVYNWGTKEQVAANFNCKAWLVVEEPELYQIF